MQGVGRGSCNWSRSQTAFSSLGTETLTVAASFPGLPRPHARRRWPGNEADNMHLGVHTSLVPRPFPPPVTVCDQKLDRGGNGLGTRLGAYQWQNIARTKMKKCMSVVSDCHEECFSESDVNFLYRTSFIHSFVILFFIPLFIHQLQM